MCVRVPAEITVPTKEIPFDSLRFPLCRNWTLIRLPRNRTELKKTKFRLFAKMADLRSQVRTLKNNLVRIVLMWLRIINYGPINPNKLPVFIKNLVKNFLHYICTFIVHSNPAHGYLCAPKVLPTHAYAISQYRKTRFILILVLLILVTPTGK